MANPTNYGWEGQTWSAIKEFMEGNEVATAAWMGNLYGESFLIPYLLEFDYPSKDPTHEISLAFTSEVDNLKITKATFQSNTMKYRGCGPGYGLAQWTYPSRKANMYDFWDKNYREGEVSIGSFNFQIAWFKEELNSPSYVSIKNHMLTVTDIDAASDYVLKWYESPLHPELSQQTRRNNSRYYYNKYTGKTPGPDPEPPGPTPTPPKKKFKWIYYIPRRY